MRMPRVTGVSPDHGPDTGGNNVTIMGSGFAYAKRVLFSNPVAPAPATNPFSITNDREIVAQPAADMLDELVHVNVISPYGNGRTNVVYQYDATGGGAPVLDSMNYDQGDSLGGGASIVLTGSGFTGATAATIGIDCDSFTVDSDTQITATLPSVVMGLMPDFDGTDDYLNIPVANNVVFSATGGSFFVLFWADSAPTTTGADYEDGNLFTDPSNAETVVGYTDLGFGCSIYDGSFQVLHDTCSTGAWHLGQVKWDGTDLKLRVDNGTWQTTPCGTLPFLAPSANCIAGRGYGGVVGGFDGRIAAYGAADSAISDADFDNLLAWVQKKFGINLGVAASNFDPTTLPLTLFYQAGDYRRGRWPAVATAGSSGSNDTSQTSTTLRPKHVFADKPGLGPGVYSVSVTGPGGTSGTLSFEFWSPAQLALTAWYRNFVGAVYPSLWVGEPSTGTSDSHDIGSLGHDPSVGSLNGFGTAVCDGVNTVMWTDPQGLADYAGDGTAGWVIGAVFNSNSLYATGGAPPLVYPYDDPAMLGNSDGIWGISHTDQGVRAWGYDAISGTGGYVIPTAADPGTGSWHTAQGRYDTSNVYLKLDTDSPVDGGTMNSGWGSEATTFVNYLSSKYTSGPPHYDGTIAELIAADSDVLAGGIDVKFQKYTAQRYGI